MSIVSETTPTVQRPVAEAVHLSKHYKVRVSGSRHGMLRAVDGIDLAVGDHQTLGLVGESGSGKSTVARLLLRLVDPTSGVIRLEDEDITHIKGKQLRRLRRRMQLVFQDPYSSFDPLSTIADSIGEAVRPHFHERAARLARTSELLDTVGLAAGLGRRHPRELSGGQLQRVAIARALAQNPSLIALDEPVSSLDVSSQAHIINLLHDLQNQLGVAYLFITHDLSVVRDVSHQLAVMYLGLVVESGPAHIVYTNPRHPYTQALLSAIPQIDPDHHTSRRRIVLRGDIPSPLAPPTGCRFHTRCPHAMDICSQQEPPTTRTTDGVTVSCHLHPPLPHPRGDQ